VEQEGGFIRLTNDNMDFTNALLTEHHVKKELAKNMGHLQEMQVELKVKMELKSQEARNLQKQRDPCLTHLQQYMMTYQ
jgi:hypothetical protein